jgi:selenium-binding protein 1
MGGAENQDDARAGHDHAHHDHEGPGYATPQAAIEESEPEELAYVMGLYVGTEVEATDVLGVVDLGPDSETYAEVVNHV